MCATNTLVLVLLLASLPQVAPMGIRIDAAASNSPQFVGNTSIGRPRNCTAVDVLDRTGHTICESYCGIGSSWHIDREHDEPQCFVDGCVKITNCTELLGWNGTESLPAICDFYCPTTVLDPEASVPKESSNDGLSTKEICAITVFLALAAVAIVTPMLLFSSKCHRCQVSTIADPGKAKDHTLDLEGTDKTFEQRLEDTKDPVLPL